MELTEAQKHLIRGLLILGVEKDAIIGIVSALPAVEQLNELMEWMGETYCGIQENQRGDTTAAILKKVAEIANATK